MSTPSGTEGCGEVSECLPKGWGSMGAPLEGVSSSAAQNVEMRSGGVRICPEAQEGNPLSECCSLPSPQASPTCCISSAQRSLSTRSYFSPAATSGSPMPAGLSLHLCSPLSTGERRASSPRLSWGTTWAVYHPFLHNYLSSNYLCCTHCWCRAVAAVWAL